MRLTRSRWFVFAAVITLLAWPLMVIGAIGGFLLGLLFFGLVGIFGPTQAILNAIQRRIRNRSTSRLAGSARATYLLAEELRVPLVKSISPPQKPVDIVVSHTYKACPLMRQSGDVWRVDQLGQLSAPLCSPSAAAVQRLIRTGGLQSGSSSHCVCPLGKYEVSFMLDAA